MAKAKFTKPLPGDHRPLRVIAGEISRLWPANVRYFGAEPYLSAMRDLSDVTDRCINDSAESVVLYFLSNANKWRGPDAARIKAELRWIIGKGPAPEVSE